MNKKIINSILAIVIASFVLTGCSSDTTTISDSNDSNNQKTQTTEKDTGSVVESEIDDASDVGEYSNIEGDTNTEEDTETKEVVETVVADTSWYEADNSSICAGTYFVGKDIKEDNYVLTCTSTEFSMQVVVFENNDNYINYYTSSRFTIGDENNAVERNAISNNYIQQDDTLAVNIHEGNVLMIKDGIGTLGKGTTQEITGNILDVCNGVYNSGDLTSGTYMLTCTKSEYGVRVVVYKNQDAYNEYVNADPFTNGEVGEAIEKNALCDSYLNTGDTYYLNIDSDTVLMIMYDGIGQLVPVNMSWK